MEWLSSDPLKAEMILWEMEKCRKYEDYIKLLDIYGNYLTTVNHQQRLDAVSAKLYKGAAGKLASMHQKRTLNSSEGITGNSMANFVTESGFYDVILQSSSPRVKPFRKWVTSEVLPAIRKNGGYMSTSNNDTPEEIMARAVMIAQETIKRREQRIEMLEQEKTLLTETIKEAAPKVEYFDKAMSSKSSYTTTQVAQEFGLSAKTLNARLAKMGVQYRQGGAWILYAKYQGNGYTHTVSVPYMMANGEQGTQIQTRWTEKGRKFLHDLMDGK